MLAPPTRLALLLLLLLAPAACRTPSAGPGLAAAEARLSEIEIRSGGEVRTASLFRPTRLKGPSPLVIVLHGGGGNGENAAMMTGMSAVAAREGFTVVYPDGTGRTRLLTWNAGHCCAYAMRQGADDVGFIAELIDELVARGIADERRIYVTGMSNGAMMTYRIGRELSGKVAAIAPVVGAMFGDEPPAASPVAMMMITGALDENVPAKGGYGDLPRWRKPPADAPYAPASATFGYWLESNACRGTGRISDTPVYQRHTGTGCAAPVVWYHLTANGHAWPGGEKGYRRGDKPVDTFDASREIWDFFSTQTLAR